MNQALQALRNQVPTQHQATFDSEMAKLSAGDQATAGGIIQKFLDLLKAFGLSINWPCVFALGFMNIIAAFSNPALILALLTQYWNCAHPAP